MTKGTTPDTHFVAIVKFVDHYYNYGDDYDTMIQSISDWEEVDDETFKLLQGASAYTSHSTNSFIVLERLHVDHPVIVNSVKAYVKYLTEQKAAKEKEEAARKAKADERRLKKLAKDEKARRELFEQLQSEFGDKK